MTENYLVVAMLAVVAFGLMFFWLVYRDRHERPHTAATGGADAQAEREFRAVFSMTSPASKEAMIEKWMRRQRCSRSEAMRLAVEEWRRDNR
jgi:hypothetical protein